MPGIDQPPAGLPAPSMEALAISRALSERIAEEIAVNGPVPFSRFMRLALYEPGYGYYMAGQHKFGPAGDFVTAPEISPLFSHCLAAQCAEVLREIPQGDILEIGGGSGVMAVETLRHLERLDCLPQKYYLLELSGELRERQRRALSDRVPHLLPRVEWLDSLEGRSLRGVVVANEVLDAMPVERFCKTSAGLELLRIDRDADNDRFRWVPGPAGEEVQAAVQTIEADLGFALPEGYCSELNLNLGPWFNTLSDCLAQGVMLLIDYGYPRREFFSTERAMGTLMCHYRHHAHGDPLQRVGLQDITAHVDFTAVAEAASAVGFTVAGYGGQADFLLACGIDRLLQAQTESRDATEVERLRAIQGFKTLMLPSEMGERFKVMAVTKQYDRPLSGFSIGNDRRHYL